MPKGSVAATCNSTDDESTVDGASSADSSKPKRKGTRRAAKPSPSRAVPESKADDTLNANTEGGGGSGGAENKAPVVKIDKDKVKERIANRRRALQQSQRTKAKEGGASTRQLSEAGKLGNFLKNEEDSRLPSDDDETGDNNTIQSAPL
jgi:hypothetical protein